MMYVVFSVILVTCQALIVIFPLLFRTPPHVNLMPLFALAVLWLHWFLFHSRSEATAFSYILWIVFGFICLQALSPTVLAAFAYADRGHKQAPSIVGKADSLREVIIVYHPGASSLPKAANARIAEKLAHDGFRVTTYTAHAGLSINLKKVSALGLSSPVYLGAVRPPLADFISRTDLTGVKCFVITTGWFKSPDQIDPVKRLIESKGGVFVGGIKLTSSGSKPINGMNTFVERIEDKFQPRNAMKD